MSEKTFIKVTNLDIYNKLNDIENNLSIMDKKVSWHTKAIGILFLLMIAIISRVL